MPRISQISPSKRGPDRLRIYIDGAFAFTIHANVVAKFYLREGMEVVADQIDQIRLGEVRQECMDYALRQIQTRLHSRTELQRKLTRREFPPDLIEEILADLTRLDYLNDQRFAKTKALSAAQYKHHGRRRAMTELLKSGVSPKDAQAALDDVYSETGVGSDPLAAAKKLAEKQAPRLRRLDPQTARRRLTGMLQRRGFDYDSIKPVIDQVLGQPDED